MYQVSDPPIVVPWGFLGGYLGETKKEIAAALAVIPEARLSYLEIILFPKREDEAPLEEYNLSSGEAGKGFCPDEEIEEAENEFADPTAAEGAMGIAPQAFLQWIQGIFGSKQKYSIRAPAAPSQEPYQSSPAQELVQEKLFDLRNELAGKPEVGGYAVGLRALVSTNSTQCVGYVCARKWTLTGYKWYLKEYYVRADGSCGSRWTRTRC